MTHVLIKGRFGFIGSNLVEHDLGRGDEILNLDFALPRLQMHAAALGRAASMFESQVVLHMAARTDRRGTTVDDYAANTNSVPRLSEPIKLKARVDQIRQWLGFRAVRDVVLVLLQLVAWLSDTLKRLLVDRFTRHSLRLNNLVTECLRDTSPVGRFVGIRRHNIPTPVTITFRWMSSAQGHQ